MEDGHMNFGTALAMMKTGRSMRRTGWNGKGMFVYLASTVKVDAPPGFENVRVLPCLVMRTAHGDLQPGWLASQADMLANDWEGAHV